MIHPRKVVRPAVLAASLLVGAVACSSPDPTPEPVITGNPADANPPGPSTTTTTTSTTTTTLFYAQ
jgi:hypothetical protein